MIKVRNKILSLLLQLTTLLIFSFGAAAQSKVEMKKIFAEAESSYLFDEYELANPLYLLLDKPDNYNIQYKIGTCYLNIPGEKAKAIPYLESMMQRLIHIKKKEPLLMPGFFWQKHI